MELKFEKWHGAQNDFMVVRLPELEQEILLSSLRRLARQFCDRHRGVGADGILVLWQNPKSPLPARLSIINSDGSLAANCGNGLRCAMASVVHAGSSPQSLLAPKTATAGRDTSTHAGKNSEKGGAIPTDTLELAVESQTMLCHLIGKSGPSFFIAVTMPTPILNDDLKWWDTGKSELAKLTSQTTVSVGTEGQGYECAGVEVANQHLVIVSERMSRHFIQEIGPKLQNVDLWDGINVHGVKPKQIQDHDQARAGQEVGGRLGSLFDVWVWERGAGETLACGSGAVAVGVQHLASGLEDRREWVGIDMPGGRLYVKQDAPESAPLLAGPAEFVYQGSINF